MEIKNRLPTLDEKSKIDNAVMFNLKLSEVRHIVCLTDKGSLTLMLRKGEDGSKYQFVLDSVPVSSDDNKLLLKAFNGVFYTV